MKKNIKLHEKNIFKSKIANQFSKSFSIWSHFYSQLSIRQVDWASDQNSDNIGDIAASIYINLRYHSSRA